MGDLRCAVCSHKVLPLQPARPCGNDARGFLLSLAIACAAPASAQSCPSPCDPIYDYATIDNKRDLGVELYVFCARQALIASEVASARDAHASAAWAAARFVGC